MSRSQQKHKVLMRQKQMIEMMSRRQRMRKMDPLSYLIQSQSKSSKCQLNAKICWPVGDKSALSALCCCFRSSLYQANFYCLSSFIRKHPQESARQKPYFHSTSQIDVVTLSKQLWTVQRQPSGSADYFDNVMMKFMINNRRDVLKTVINLFFTITNCRTACSRSLACSLNCKFMYLSAY